jgi:hypothetical protein
MFCTSCPTVVSAAQSTIRNTTSGTDGTSTKAEKNLVDTLRAKVAVNLNIDMNWPSDENAAARDVSILLGSTLQDRLTKLYKNAKSSYCRAKIAEHFGYLINAIALEESLPLTDVSFPNECGETVYDWNDLPESMHIGDVQNRSYQPPRNESVYIDDPSDLNLLYVVLTHDNANATTGIRLVEELYEAYLHQFVMHVDFIANGPLLPRSALRTITTRFAMLAHSQGTHSLVPVQGMSRCGGRTRISL